MSGSGGGSYLQDLNVLPPTDINDGDAFNQDDLAIFTNTRFFDFDMGPKERREEEGEGGNRAVEEGGDGDTRADLVERDGLIDPRLKSGSMGFLNAHISGDLDFDPYGYSTYLFGSLPPTSTHQPTPSSLAGDANIDRDLAPGMVSPDSSHRHHPVPPPPPPAAPLSEPSSPGQSPYPIATSPSPRGMRTRKASTASSSEHIQSPSSEQFNFGGDESGSGSHAAVDEDKRRRNTAASARFRVKKKEKEAQLAKDAKEAAEKVKLMEAKIKKLEEQNEWLKSLLLEKKKALPKAQETTEESVTTKEKDS